MIASSAPILSCAETGELEKRLFGGDEAAEWAAMRRAGQAVAAAVLADYREIGGLPSAARFLVLAGKGHNAGDALIAAGEILAKFPGAQAEVVFVFGSRALRPLAQRAWRELMEGGRERVIVRDAAGSGVLYDLCLDGVFGFQFRPPLEERAIAALRWANGLAIRVRAAVDLPSGLNEKDAFCADFTYATGVVKTPLLSCPNAGRLRYLDLGFFSSGEASPSWADHDRVLTPAVLGPLAALRRSHSDTRSHGHVMIVGGSLRYPGAILMTALSALRSGVGLVTAFVPESLVPAYAARAPEAMWVGWPASGPGSDDSAGGLTEAGLPLLTDRWEKAAALVVGPGMGRHPKTHALLLKIVGSTPVPIVIDADALQPDVVRAVKVPHILTPHAGEFERIAGGADLEGFCRQTGATVVLKGPVTRISGAAPPVCCSFFGGPVLARGGSGDLLAGLVGGLLAQTPGDPLWAACSAAVWHGRSADLLARAHGQTAVSVTQLLDFLPEALRDLL